MSTVKEPNPNRIAGIDFTLCEIKIMILHLYLDSNSEIAKVHGCKKSTVKTHNKNINQKLNSKGHRAIIRFGHVNGLFNNGFFKNQYLFAGNTKVPWKHDGLKLVL